MKVNSDLTIICVAGLRLLIGSGGPAPCEYRVAQPFLLLLVRHGEIPFAKADNHSIVQSHIVRLLVNSLDLTFGSELTLTGSAGFSLCFALTAGLTGSSLGISPFRSFKLCNVFAITL